MNNFEVDDEVAHGRWYGDDFCPHPGETCIDGCYFCGRPVDRGPHDHTMIEQKGFKGAEQDRFSCVCPNC